MGARPRLFLDASVLIAAAGSTEGGSALVLEICRAGLATPLLTRLVLREAERNIQDKLDREGLLRFYHLIAELGPKLAPIPGEEELAKAGRAVAAKGADVLAGARNAKATHLITLDRRHFLKDHQREAILPIVACTPREFLEDTLNSS